MTAADRIRETLAEGDAIRNRSTIRKLIEEASAAAWLRSNDLLARALAELLSPRATQADLAEVTWACMKEGGTGLVGSWQREAFVHVSAALVDAEYAILGVTEMAMRIAERHPPVSPLASEGPC